jgi:hypothetical protein
MVLLLLIGLAPPVYAQPPVGLVRITSSVSPPILADRSLIWLEHDEQTSRLHRYDLISRTSHTLAERSATILALAADGRSVAWAERAADGVVRVWWLDDRAGAPQMLPLTLGDGLPELALMGETLFYTDATSGHQGLFAYDRATATETLLSTMGQRPVARGGLLLWSEAEPTAATGRWLWRLHGRSATGELRVLAEREAGYGGLSGYDTDGQRVVWAFEPSSGDGRVYVQRWADAVATPLNERNGSAPRIAGERVLWAALNEDLHWQIHAANLASGEQWALTEPSEAALDALGIAAGRAVFAVEQPFGAGREVYHADVQARQVTLPVAPTVAATPSACDRAIPSGCGHVSVQGNQLVDLAGVWQMRGVQFFLPQFGINEKTFHTANYASAKADGSLVYWLDRAQHYLHANLLRIFVELPYESGGTVITPTDYATLFDFATLANHRGMRLGISLHNSADWNMSEARANWIRGLIDYFDARGGLATLAYVSADNEINNHCSRGGADCFDSDGQHNASAYINGAIEWTARVRSVVKGRLPQLLVTVGISTEMRDVDNTRGAFNFFRRDSQGRTLASLVDFLSPHNYGGGAAGIVEDIRYAGFAGPVVLEEYGFPSDPLTQHPSRTEGALICRIDPNNAVCVNTAPFYVEQNIIAMRSRGYAGGVAWMLADMREKNSGSACSSKPFDLWTGLFAIGGTYCGGTFNTALGHPKATAVRVCAFHVGSVAACDWGVPRLYLPVAMR